MYTYISFSFLSLFLLRCHAFIAFIYLRHDMLSCLSSSADAIDAFLPILSPTLSLSLRRFDFRCFSLTRSAQKRRRASKRVKRRGERAAHGRGRRCARYALQSKTCCCATAACAAARKCDFRAWSARGGAVRSVTARWRARHERASV